MDRVDQLISGFPDFISAFERYCPFKRIGQLSSHLATIARLRDLGSPEAALNDELFLRSLYETLQAWGIGSRRSVLKPYPSFIYALKVSKNKIAELSSITIDMASIDSAWVGARVGELIETLDIVENETKIVAGSKTLHHLLPDLVPPMDRYYSQTFFGWNDSRFQHRTKECVVEALRNFAEMALATNPVQYVNDGWHSSRTKVMDNAIVGWLCLFKEKYKAPVPDTET